MLGLLRQHDFRQYFVATAVSQLATPITALALPYLAVTSLHASASEVGLLATAELLPVAVFALPSGAVVDRRRRVSVMRAMDVARAIVLVTVPVLWWLDALTMLALYAVGLVIGSLSVFFDAASMTILPQLAGPGELIEGNAKMEGLASVVSVGGPAIGGFLIRLLTGPVAVLLDAVSYLGSALFLSRIRRHEERPEPTEAPHLGREIRDGLTFVYGHRLVRDLLISASVYNFFGTGLSAMLILLLAGKIGLTAGWIGLFMSIAAAGGLLGAFTARRLAERFGQGQTMVGVFLVTTPLLFAVPLARPGVSTWVAAVCFSLAGAGVTVWNIIQRAFRQQLTPPELLGRAQASARFVAWGLMPVSAALSGFAAEAFGVRATMTVCVFGECLAIVPLLLSPLRSMRTLAMAAPVTAPVAA